MKTTNQANYNTYTKKKDVRKTVQAETKAELVNGKTEITTETKQVAAGEIRKSASQTRVTTQEVSKSEAEQHSKTVIQSSTVQDTSSKQSFAAHHRRNVLASSEDVSNQILHRKGLQTTTEALHATSSSALDMRKSLSNIHEQVLLCEIQIKECNFFIIII